MNTYSDNPKTDTGGAVSLSQDTIGETPAIITSVPHETRILVEPDAIKSMKYARNYQTKPLGTYQRFVTQSGSVIGCLGMIPCCLCSNPWTEVQQGTVGLVTQFGELSRVVDPGATYVNILSEKLTKVSIMTQVQDIPEQACLTRDNVIVHLKSVLYYNIVDPQKAVFGISDINSAVSERTQTTLRDVIGARALQEVIERREEIAEAIQLIIKEVTAEWGVKVESILIKDLRLSNEITQSLSQAAQAKRIGESKIITAKAEVESAKLMRQAADILASKPAMQIRYLEAMQNIAKSSNSKLIFLPSSGDVERSAAHVSGPVEGDLGNFTANDIARQITLNESLK